MREYYIASVSWGKDSLYMRILYGDPVEAENGKLERLQKRLKGGGV